MRYFIIIISFIISQNLFGQNQTVQQPSIESRNQKAIQFFHEKKYDDALSEWTSIMNQGGKGADLYYNVANAYYRLSNYPKSILFYNRALKWNPHCGDCKKNLALAQKQAGIENFELPEFIVHQIYKNIVFVLQPFNWFILFILFLSAGIACHFLKNKMPRLIANKKTILLFYAFSLICLLFAWNGDRFQHQSNTIIIMQAVKLLYSPDPNSEIKQDLLPGMKLKCTDQIQSWLKVQTPELDYGWVEEKKVAYIGL